MIKNFLKYLNIKKNNSNNKKNQIKKKFIFIYLKIAK